ncbi:hypothetical protein EAN04_24605 [Salmonella enterica]|nr:hypothetical protein [Salmonella enterica]
MTTLKLNRSTTHKDAPVIVGKKKLIVPVKGQVTEPEAPESLPEAVAVTEEPAATPKSEKHVEPPLCEHDQAQRDAARMRRQLISEHNHNFFKTTWPELFGKKLLALKLGILEEMMADIEARQLGVTLKTMKGMLQWYCGRRQYHVMLTRGGERFGLDGKPCGEILPNHVERSMELLKSAIKRKNKAK